MPQEEVPLGQNLENAIVKLQQERQSHLEAIAEIDRVFDRFGIASQERRKRGRPRGRRTARARSKAGRRSSKKRVGRPSMTRASKKRRKATMGTTTRRQGGSRRHSVSGPEFVVQFVTRKGEKGATSSEISERWASEKRGKGVYVVLGKLVRDKRLKKHAMEGRGSRYTAA